MKNAKQDAINKLIEAKQKQIGLLSELQKAQQSEEFRYVVRYEFTQGNVKNYSLLDRTTNTVRIDPMPRIESYLRLRNIEESQVYYWK